MKKLLIISMLLLLIKSGNVFSQTLTEVCYDEPLFLNEGFDLATKSELEWWLGIIIYDENDNMVHTPFGSNAVPGSSPCSWLLRNIGVKNTIPIPMADYSNVNYKVTMRQLLNGSGVSLVDGKVYKIKSAAISSCHQWIRESSFTRRFRLLSPGLIGDNNSYVCFGGEYNIKNLTPASGATNNSPVYSWQYSNGTPIYGQSGETMNLTSITSPVSVQRVVTNANCPITYYSNVVTINPYPQFSSAGTITQEQAICDGAAPNTLTGTSPVGGKGDYRYQWKEGIDPNSLTAKNQTGSSYSPDPLTETTYYQRDVTDYCGTLSSNILKVTVYSPVTEGTINNPSPICYNTVPSPLICSNPSGGTGVYTYQWQWLSNGIYEDIPGATDPSYTPSELTVTTTYRRVATSGGCGSAATKPVTITVNQPFDPGTIGSDSNGDGSLGGDQIVCNGARPSPLIGTTPSGAYGNYQYQWQSSTTTNEQDFQDIAGAINATYTPTAQAITTVRYYRRGVKSSPCAPVFSNFIKITTSAPLAEGTLSAPQTVCFGANADMLTATSPSGGTGTYTFSWEYSESNNYSWQTLYGIISSTYIPSSLKITTFYRRTVTSGTCGRVTGNEIKIQVRDELKEGTPSQDQTIPFNTAPSVLSCSPPSGGIPSEYQYQWQWSNNNSDPWTSISGATGTTFTPGNLTSSIFFRRSVTCSCGTAYSQGIKISILGQVSAGTIMRDQVICSGNAAEDITGTEPSGGNGPGSYSYTWEKSTNNLTWATIPGAVFNSLNPGELTQTTHFHRIVSSAGAGSSTSNNVTITVTPNLTEGTVTREQTICYSTTPEPLTGTSPSGGITSEYQFQWQQSRDPYSFQNIQGATTEGYIPPELTTTTYYRRALTTKSCGTVYSNYVAISVLPELKEGTPSQDQTVCFGYAPSRMTVTNPSGGTGSFQYQWQWSSDNSEFYNIANASQSSYTSATTLTSNTYYRRYVKSGNCGPVYSESLLVNVRSEIIPGIIGEDQRICYDTAPNTIFGDEASGGTGTIDYSWEKSSDGNNFVKIFNESGATFSPPAIKVTTFYRRVATSNPCGSSASNIVKITVPGLLTEGSVPSPQSVCYGDVPNTLTISAPSGGIGAYTYQWQSAGNSLAFKNIEGETSSSFSPGIVTMDTVFRRVTTSGGCGSVNSLNIKITVYKPLFSGTISASQVICTGNSANTLNGTVPSGGNGIYRYQWLTSDDSIVFDNISSATSTIYNPGQLASGKFYSRVVINTCGIDTSNIVHIAVLPKLTPGQVTDNQTVCNGAVPLELTGSTPGGGNGIYYYTWQKSFDNTLFVNVNGTLDSYTPDAAMRDIYYRRQVVSANCSPEYSNSVSISVLPVIVAGTIDNNQSVCYNKEPSTLNGPEASGGNGTFEYQWQDSIPSRQWANVPGETGLSYSPQALKQTTYYRRNALSGSCGTMSSNILTVRVYDKVSGGAISKDQIICNNSQGGVLQDSIVPSGGTGSFQYQWQWSKNLSRWEDIPNALLAEYDPGILDSTKYYRRAATNTCATALSNVITINVLEKVKGGQIGDAQSICFGLKPWSLIGSDASGALDNFSYQWQKSTDSLSWPNIINATGSGYSPDTLKSTTWYRRLAKSSTCGNAFSNIIKIRVMPDVEPGSILPTQTICNNDTAKTITGTGATGGSGVFSYSWEYSANSNDWVKIIFSSDGVTYSPGALKGTTMYRRKVSTLGCKDKYTNTSFVYVLSEVEKPLVDVQSAYCKNSQVSLIAQGPTTYNFGWYNPVNILVGEGRTFTIPSFSFDQKYYVKALRQDGCKSVNQELLLKLDNIKADFTPDGNEVYLGGAIMFQNKSISAKSYVWEFFEGDLSFEENPWHYFNILGKKSIQLIATSENGCTDTLVLKDYINVIPVMFSNEMQSLKFNPDSFDITSIHIAAWPNPCTSEVNLETTYKMDKVLLTDMWGKIYYSSEGVPGESKINTYNLTPGIYILKIWIYNNLKTIKIIKQ